MKCLLVTIAWIISCSGINALVHYVKLEKGEKGCKSPKGAQMAVGDVEQDDKTCGAYTCQSTEGDAFVHFCQIPVTFAECVETAVLTNVDFPQCCWTCAAWAKCNGAGGDGAAGGGGEGAGGAEGGGEGGGGAEGGAEGGGEAAAEARSPIDRSKSDKYTKVARTASTVEDTTTERGKPRSKGKGGSKRSTIKPDESEFPEENPNIKFGGKSPISKFGEDGL
ncbi:short stature homeobox protein 2 [Drosophila biarmipes]|uniref:short stature homeobox protein 2 n=1 Tax=Drosophila biarmipes TaxID=125945 RepID=UPI0007E631CB|nr:short stature homeobox protein 2 [Drosophila biarmipes]